MIDIHMAIGENADPRWLELCLKSLENEPITLHIIEPVMGDFGEMRKRGLSKGTHEFVGWVDPDDMIIPGSYQMLLNVIGRNEFAWMNEQVWDLTRDKSRVYNIWEEQRPHHMHIIRRDSFDLKDIPELIGKEDRHKKWLYGMSETGGHLNQVGYIWRNYSSSSTREYFRHHGGTNAARNQA